MQPLMRIRRDPGVEQMAHIETLLVELRVKIEELRGLARDVQGAARTRAARRGAWSPDGAPRRSVKKKR
jgi:hypothetical protein